MAHRETPISEITLRRYEKPYASNKRELLKKACLSLGLLNPGDSRDVIVDILYIFLEAKKELSAEEIVKNVVQARLEFERVVIIKAGIPDPSEEYSSGHVAFIGLHLYLKQLES